VDSANKENGYGTCRGAPFEYIRQHNRRLVTPASPTIWLRMQVLLTLWLIAYHRHLLMSVNASWRFGETETSEAEACSSCKF
jgi:hypothetical protein